jgi:hypothetical protein
LCLKESQHHPAGSLSLIHIAMNVFQLPQEKSPSRRNRSPFAKPVFPATIIGVFLVVALVAWAVFRAPNAPQTNEPQFHNLLIQEAQAKDNFSLTPTESDSFGVSPTTAFRLTSKIDISCDDVADSLTLTPTVKTSVKTVSNRECSVSPASPLEAGELYRIALGATVQNASGTSKQLYQWAYQAKTELAIAGSIPRDKAGAVPIDTGIDVTFNTNLVENFDRYFSIEPASKGRFEKHGRTWSFVPEERLAVGTVYTVTVRAGLPLNDSAVALAEDYRFRFATEKTPEPRDIYSPPMNNAFTAVKPNEPPVIDFLYNTPPSDVTATVYQFESADDFIERYKAIDAIPSWAYGLRDDALISIDGLEKVGEFPLATQANALVFSSGFDRGTYLISFPIGKRTFHTPLVVSDIAASLTLSKTNSVLWLYDLKTNEPLVDATVRNTLNDEKTTSDADGVAELTTPKELVADASGSLERNRAYFRITANDGRQTIIPAVPESYGIYEMSSSGGVTRRSDSYWVYLWTDRTLYRPTDTLNLWGVLRYRDNPKKESLTFSVWSYNLVDASGEFVPVASATAETGSFGTYTASVPLRSLTPGYYTVSAKVGDDTIAMRSFSVQKFAKPAYQIIASADTAAVIEGDSVQYDIATQFYDGTPAPNIKLRYASWGQAGDAGTDITTDENGRASFSRTMTLSYGDRRYAATDTLTFFPAESAEGDISESVSVLVYPSAVTFTPTVEQEGDRATIDLTTYFVDLKRAESDIASVFGSSWATSDVNGKPAPNTEIEGTVYEIVTTKTKQGTRYDFLEKKVVDVYYYESHNEKREDFSGKTDENGDFTKSFTIPRDAYLIDIAAKDASDRSVLRTVYVYKQQSSAGLNQTRYTLRDPNNANQNWMWSPTPTKKYAIGESTTLGFLKDGEAVANEGTFLYIKLQNGIRDITVSQQSSLPVTFDAADIPNVYYTAVRFHDGVFTGTFNEWDLPKLQFDEQTRKLTVSISPDQEEYEPGEEASLNISVRDKDGKPARAAVNVSVIDEALAAIQAENPAVPLASLYSTMGAGILQQYASHRASNLEMGAEGGGCFTGETLIRMADGSSKPIQDVRVGDTIQTFADAATSKRIAAAVAKVYRHIVTDLLLLNDRITTTPEHVMLVNGEWATAGTIRIGDTLRGADGAAVRITSIRAEHRKTLVYNLDVANTHTFFAGGVYVHNQKGGERNLFKDAAYFGEVETGDNGIATISVPLPDNITSWRVTAQAVSSDLFAGSATAALPATKALFGILTMSEEYVVNDKPVIFASAYGDALTSGDDVEMTLAIPSLSVSETRTVKGFAAERFLLPSLVVGDHESTLTVTRGDATDTLVRTFTVLPSRLTKNTSEYRDVKAGMNFSSPSNTRSTLVFSDAGRGRILSTLETLQWSWGKRADRSLAAQVARDALEELDSGIPRADVGFVPADFQQEDGGVSLLSYGSSDLRLSAFAAVRADLFNAEQLRTYFLKKLTQKDASLEQIGTALLGLANLGDAVLSDLGTYLTLEGITDEHRLIAALAYNALGAQNLSAPIVQKLLEQYGETQDPYIRLTLGSTDDEKILHSAEISILAEALKLPERIGLGEYCEKNFPKDTITNLERAIAMRVAIPVLDDSDASLTYRIGEKEETVSFKERRTFPLSATPDELTTLAITAVNGSVGVVQSSLVAIDPNAEPRDTRLQINKAYSRVGGSGAIQQGDIVKVTLTPSITRGAVIDQGFLAVDEIPSGLVLLTRPWERGIEFDKDLGYPVEIDGQRVTFYTSGKRLFHYYIRVFTPGIFAAEPAILQGDRSRDIVTYSGAQSLEIR